MSAGKTSAFLLGLVLCASAFALDNPDAPPRVTQFLVKAKPYEDRLAAESSQPQFGQAADAYSQFLDAELNDVYSALLRHLDLPNRQALVRSQRDWLAFRNSEFGFIDANWSRAHFGNSSMISRADYRTAILKQRVVTLLQYLQNYND